MLDFFLIMFAGDILQSSVAATNESQEMGNDPLTIQEYLKFLPDARHDAVPLG